MIVVDILEISFKLLQIYIVFGAQILLFNVLIWKHIHYFLKKIFDSNISM